MKCQEPDVKEFVVWMQSVFGKQMDTSFNKTSAKTQVNGKGWESGWREILYIV